MILKRFSFPKSRKLTTNGQFKGVLDKKLSVRDGLMVLYMAENKLDIPRLGISVPKTCGNAVLRNRLKRLVRETFRHNQHKIPHNFDYVVIMSAQCKEKYKNITLQQLSDSFLSLINKTCEKADIKLNNRIN